MISTQTLQSVLDFYTLKGEEQTLNKFDISSESLNRYLREAKERGLEGIGISKSIRDIISNYSESELLAIAKGGRVMPGYAKPPLISFEGERIRIGHITDTHIGSAYFNDERLYQAFDEFKKEKVDFITHSGDVTEGMSHRPGHIYELTELGYDKQKEKAVSLFSQWGDTDIYAIDGNHDRWYIKSNGAIVVKDIASVLSNFHFLGHDEADISLKGKVVLKLWHGEDGNSYALCLDDKTEIFTENGWKLFKDLEHSEMVATLNPSSNKLEFQLPTDYVTQEYKGDMISFQGQKYDMVVTPDHRMWAKRAWKDKWEFVHAKDITQGRQWKVNRIIPNWEGYNSDMIFLNLPSKAKTGGCTNYVNSVDIKLWAEFVGWMLSEGNISHANQRVEISQNKKVNPDKCDRIINLIKQMGFTCYQDSRRISVNSKQLYEIFKDMGHSHEKRIDPSLKNAKIDVLLSLLDGLFLGDGTMKNGRYQNYTTNSPRLADDVQEILLKCGISAVIKRYDDRKSGFNQTRPIYQISCSYKMTEPEIWSLSGGEKPHIMIVGHVHKYVKIFVRNVWAVSVGSLQKQTQWMRSKRIAANVGFCIADYWVNDTGIAKIRETWYPFYV